MCRLSSLRPRARQSQSLTRASSLCLTTVVPVLSWNEVAASYGVGHSGSSRGVAVGDFDGDGDNDIYVVNCCGQANILLRNNGDGNFADIATTAGVADTGDGQGCAFADYDGDGNLDLYVTNYGQANKLYKNNGDSTFSDVSTAAGK